MAPTTPMTQQDTMIERSVDLLLSICNQMTSEYMFNVHQTPLHLLMPAQLLHDIEHLIDDMHSQPDHWFHHVLTPRSVDWTKKDPVHMILFTLYQYRSYERRFCSMHDDGSSKTKTAMVIEMLEEFIEHNHHPHTNIASFVTSLNAQLILLSHWLLDQISVIGLARDSKLAAAAVGKNGPFYEIFSFRGVEYDYA